jgi:glycyl-tRNA synthetase
MFKTHIGPVEDSSSTVYLRPETAQGIFVDYKTMQASMGKKIPFGIAQIGKAYRNEITPGNFTFRMREFEQMEIEYFVEPGTDEKWHSYWLEARMNWYKKYGMQENKLRLREHAKDELSHYSKATFDIEYQFPWGWGELEGIANRTDYDLSAHQRFSGKDLSYFDDVSKKTFIPYVIEPSAGADRATLAFLIDSYFEDGKRVLLKLHPQLAPVKVAVFPLVSNKEEIVSAARKIFEKLRLHFVVAWDDRGNIGKRYYAQDEIGTPWCVTIDYDTLKDNAVTIRDRDSAQQTRVKIDALVSYFESGLMKESI